MKSKFIALCEEKRLIDECESFVNAMLTQQCPIIENIPNDTHNKLVTFIYCGDQHTNGVNLYSPLIGIFPKRMTRLNNTNYFYYTLVVPNDIRVSYAFIPNDPTHYDEVQNNEQRMQLFTTMWSKLIPDPNNTKKIHLKNGMPAVKITTSILEMPLAPSQQWNEHNISAPSGQIKKINIDSKVLQANRNYWVYLPPLYDNNSRYPLLIVFDGQLFYESGLSLPTMLDNLIFENKIPPLVAVLIDSIGFYERAIDLRCSEKFLQFMTDELLPVINAKYSISNDRLDKILMGASLGGLFSIYSALRRPDLFANVLSHSGGGHSMFSELLHRDAEYPLKIYLDIGSLESQVAAEEDRDLLLSAGHTVIYHIFPGAHDLVCWETSTPNALMQLLSRTLSIIK